MKSATVMSAALMSLTKGQRNRHVFETISLLQVHLLPSVTAYGAGLLDLGLPGFTFL